MDEKIIDDYLREVTKDMGARQREDVARELRTHILDSADALAAERKTAIDDAIVREVIAKMGPARKVAALYPTPRTFLEMGELKGMWDAIKVLGGIALACLLVAGVLWVLSPETLNAGAIQIVRGLVTALAIAIVVIAVIFLAMYLYESRLKVPYEARLKRFEKSLNDAASPLKIGLTIIGALLGLVLLNVFWSQVPFLADLGENAPWVKLLSPDFAQLLPWFSLLFVLNIGVQLLYLAVRRKWVPALLEAALSFGSALLLVWALVLFPFNTAQLSAGIQTGARVVLAILIVLTLFDVAKKLWTTAQFFINERYERKSAA